MHSKTIQRRKRNSKLGKNKSKKIKRGGANTANNEQLATLMADGKSIKQAKWNYVQDIMGKLLN